MFNRDTFQDHLMSGVVAALALSVLVVLASLTHAVAAMTAYA